MLEIHNTNDFTFLCLIHFTGQVWNIQQFKHNDFACAKVRHINCFSFHEQLPHRPQFLLNMSSKYLRNWNNAIQFIQFYKIFSFRPWYFTGNWRGFDPADNNLF